MKRFLLLSLWVFSAWGADSDKIQSPILKEPSKTALQAEKLVFVCFGASWCGPCKKLHKILEHEPVKPVWDKYFVTVHVVVDERGDQAKLNAPGGNELRKSLGGADSGIPFFAFLQPDGTLLGDSFMASGQNMGCPVTVEEISAFMEILEEIAPAMTPSERKTIEKAFRR